MPDLHPLWVVVGLGGSGKTTVVAEVIKRVQGLQELVSITTRPMRAGETQGHPYRFTSHSEFTFMSNWGLFLQQSEFGGYLYGITEGEAESKLMTGPAIAIVVGDSIEDFKRGLPNPVYSIYLQTSLQNCVHRMRDLRGDSGEVMTERVRADRAIFPYRDKTDFVVDNNGDLELAVSEVVRIICGTP